MSREELDDLPFGVITLDRQGKVLRYNRVESILSRRSAATTVGSDFFTDIAPCANVQGFRGRFDAFANSHESGIEHFNFSFNFRWGRQDVSITLVRKRDHDDINLLVRGHALDATATNIVSERRQLPHILHARGGDAGIDSDAYGARALAAPAICRLGGSEEAALRRDIHTDDTAAVARLIAEATRNRTPYAIEYRRVRADQSIALMQESGSFLEAGAPGCATVIDISARRQSERENWRAAYYDWLTGLPTTRLLLLRVADAIRAAEAGDGIAAIIVANIDKFFEISDTFGYKIGNRLLQMLGLRLGECVREGDTVARMGSDFFALLLTGIDGARSVAEAAARLSAAASRPFVIDERSYYLTISIGISLTPSDGRDPSDLVHAADTAMRAAKAEGRGRLRWYDTAMSIDARTNNRQRDELRAAIGNNELELHYQPIVDIGRDRVVAVESLVRWNHPTRGFLGPGEFIAFADRTGLIVPLGEWILREACRQAREWRDLGFDLRVCVNVSAAQFRQPHFVALVASIVAEHDIAPGRIELELTESVMVDGFAGMIEKLGQLKALGLRLAIDDFGTGYSSLAYLKYFPVDTLKIDRAFVTDICLDKFDRAIATTVLTLANELNFDCVVEGVETAEQLDTLSAIGCTIMQGYYFCRPLKPAALHAILGQSATTLQPS